MNESREREDFLVYYRSLRYVFVRICWLAAWMLVGLGVFGMVRGQMDAAFFGVPALLLGIALSQVILDDGRKAERWVR